MELPVSRAIHLGVTGTREGCTHAQKVTVNATLAKADAYARGQEATVWLHHGDCVGVDAEIATVAKDGFGWKVHSHPPVDPKLRAWVPSDRIDDPLPYLDRNRVIVARSSYLLACTREPVGHMDWCASYIPGEGGTIYTIKHALKQGLIVRVVQPDGGVLIP